MRYTQHQSNNGVLGAPKGWDQGALPCGALPITRTEIDGIPAMVSYWRPEPEELAILNQGGFITVHVIGELHPPIAIGASE